MKEDLKQRIKRELPQDADDWSKVPVLVVALFWAFAPALVVLYLLMRLL